MMSNGALKREGLEALLLILVNTLRRAAGQEELGAESAANFVVEIPRVADDPEWIAREPQFIVNGTELLQRGEVPLSRVNELLGQLEEGRYILLVTNFEPTPILEAMQNSAGVCFIKSTLKKLYNRSLLFNRPGSFLPI
jgi:hypothetical protein